MPFRQLAQNRKPNRMLQQDYSAPGAYFVTICTLGMVEHLGDTDSGRMELNDFGIIVETQWRWAFDHFDGIETDAFVVMPNHVHGIVFITDPTVVPPAATVPTYGSGTTTSVAPTTAVPPTASYVTPTPVPTPSPRANGRRADGWSNRRRNRCTYPWRRGVTTRCRKPSTRSKPHRRNTSTSQGTPNSGGSGRSTTTSSATPRNCPGSDATSPTTP